MTSQEILCRSHTTPQRVHFLESQDRTIRGRGRWRQSDFCVKLRQERLKALGFWDFGRNGVPGGTMVTRVIRQPTALLALLSVLALAEPARAHSVVAKLDRVLPELRLCDCNLGDVLDFLADVSDLEIEVDWKGLGAMGVTKDTVVTARLRSATLRRTLEKVLAEAAGRPRAIAF